MGVAEVKKQMKLEHLYETAFNLFSDKGVAKTTIAEIAEKAGVAKGTFYLYFKDKYDLRDRLVAYKASQLFDDAYQRMLEDKPETFKDQLWAVFQGVIRELERKPLILSFMSKDLSWGVFKHALEHSHTMEVSRTVEQYLSMIRETGVKCREPELLLFTVVELVGSTCNSCILYQQPMTMGEYLPWLKMTVYGIVDLFLEKPRC